MSNLLRAIGRPAIVMNSARPHAVAKAAHSTLAPPLARCGYPRPRGKCFCPAARNRPGRPGDRHCECPPFTHGTILATALDRPIPVEFVETVRRGGKDSRLVARLG